MAELPARFLRNTISNYLNTGTTAAITLVMTPVLANGLGAEGYGIWAFAGSLALYLELFEFGFGAATIKYVAAFAATGETVRMKRAIATSFWALTVPGVLALLIGGAVALAFPAIFGDLDPDTARAAQIVILLVTVDLAISIPGDTFGGTLLGLQRYDLVNATLVVVAVAQAVSWAVILATGGGLVEIAVATVALSLLGQLSRFLIAVALLGGIDLRPRRVDRSLLRPYARLSVWIALTEASLLAVARLDTIIVGLVAGLPAAGVYAVGQKIPLAVNMVLGQTTKLFYPHSAELAARRSAGLLRGAFLTGNRLSLAVALPLCLTLAVLATPILDVWVGEDFAGAATIVVLLLAAMAVWAVSRVGLLIMQGMGEPRMPALVHVGEAVANVCLSIGLGAAMGADGVALGTLIAAVVANLAIFVPLLCRRFGVPLRAFAASVARAHGPAGAVGAAVGVALLQAGLDTLVEVAAAGAAMLAAYLAMFVLTGLTRDELGRLRGALAR
jgi:O-antigen/teichoic acid export membrane protein